jgi:uncharacterized repeat protein (TIGR01451 family)
MNRLKYCTRGLTILVLLLLGLISFMILPSQFSKGAIIENSLPASGLQLTDQANSKTPLSQVVDPQTQARIDEAYAKMPLSFEANHGQTVPQVKFLSRHSASDLYLTSTEAVLVLKSPQPKKQQKENLADVQQINQPASVLRLKVLGANPTAPVEGLDPLPGKSNYFKGNDASQWQTAIPNYTKVQYSDIYKGINLIYYGNQRQLEYDFVVASGADPNTIKLAFDGARKLRIDANGDLLLSTKTGDVRMHKPYVYQETENGRQTVTSRYVLKGKRQVGFEVAAYDNSKPLTIDPVLSYSTFLGGSNYEEGRSIAVDSSGNAYVTGRTSSFNFPAGKDAFSSTYANGTDVFVTKMFPTGSAFVYSTYLGGNSDDFSYGITIDSAGNAYITGATSSTNFPTTSNAYDTTLGSTYTNDAFVTKLNSAGTALVYSTFVGGNNNDQGNGIAVDSSGNAYITGITISANFPTTAGVFQTVYNTSTSEAFVTKLDSAGTALIYSTFLGGTGSEQGNGIAVDSSGNAYVTGNTTSTNFPTTAGALQTVYGGGLNNCCYYVSGDAFVTKLNPTATGLVYSTYLGGNSDENGSGIVVTPADEVYLTGSTNSVNFPTTPGVIRVSNGGVAKSIDDTSNWLASSTGITASSVNALAINPSTPATIYAGTTSGVFKSTNGGTSWSANSAGLTDLNIQSMAINPVTPSTIYLGTINRGVFKSTNSGSSWRAVNTGQNGTVIYDLKIDPLTPSTIYAGTDQRVFKTTNSGASWTQLQTGLSQVGYVKTLYIDPVNPSTIYLGGSGGVYKSANGGASWSLTGFSQSPINALVVNPSSPAIVYASTASGIVKSTDGGDSWSSANTGLTNRSVNSLAISPADSSIVYAGTGNGVFKSTNGGNTWSSAPAGLVGAVISALVVDPLTPATIYSGSLSGNLDAFVSRLNSTGTSLIYSTYLGAGSFNNYNSYSTDQGNGIAVDSSGNAYVTGYTNSPNFPTTKGGFQTIGCCSEYDGFMSKLNPTGTTLTYSTYLGGSSNDQAWGIAVDASNSAYVVGTTGSQNFPVTDEAYQSVLNNYGDAFITKFVAAPSITSDIAVSMVATPNSGIVGSDITYTITVTNNGPERAYSVFVNDDLPSSLIFTNCNAYPLYCTSIGNSVSFTLASLEVGESKTLIIYARVSCAISNSAVIQNTVTVDSSALDAETTNNSATATITANNTPTSLSPTNQAFPGNGGSNNVSVNRGSNCNWTASSNANWITIDYSSNCCNGSVGYTVAPNNGAARSGTMTIAGQTFTVTQSAGPCIYTISPTNMAFAASGGSNNVNVTATANCTWQTSSDSFWINVFSGSTGTGNGSFSYSVFPNDTGIPRTGHITVGGQTFTISQGQAFSDVPGNHPFYNEIGKLAGRGVMPGCNGANFCPNDLITREEMAAFIMRARGEFNPPTPASQRFPDVLPSNPFYAFIERMAVLQITLGCGGGNYCPSGVVSRDQMAAFIIRALHDPGYVPPTPGSQRFNDVPSNNVFYGYIDELAVRGVTLGCSASPPLYCPDNTVTRGEMAAFLVRAFNL